MFVNYYVFFFTFSLEINSENNRKVFIKIVCLDSVALEGFIKPLNTILGVCLCLYSFVFVYVCLCLFMFVYVCLCLLFCLILFIHICFFFYIFQDQLRLQVILVLNLFDFSLMF